MAGRDPAGVGPGQLRLCVSSRRGDTRAGAGILVGTIIWFDLRLLGVWMRHQPVSRVFGSLKPWMLGGFAVMFVTGALLFTSLATSACVHPYFQIKIVLLVLAGLNVAFYTFTIDRRRHQWDEAPTPPVPARIAGLVSLVLWAGVIAAGRIMAYTL